MTAGRLVTGRGVSLARRWRGGMLLWGLLACGVPARGAAQTTEQLAREALEHAKAGGHVAWDSARPLTWSDFRARPHAGLFKAAETVSTVTYLIGCLGQEARFTVLTTFSTMESWVRPDVRADPAASAAMLRHERTHFDLTELFGRELRRALGAADGLCPHDLARARALFDSLDTASRQLQDRYDRETAHGTHGEQQAAWSAWVQAWLATPVTLEAHAAGAAGR
ncbi:MAG: hypothetical protein KA180_06820 [Gemmatimonadales bacterium]|nr:hypothetical protein [Gemmatimonadales bacterium]